MNKQSVWPTEIRLSQDKRSLTVSFDDGSRHTIAAELLRVESPSAEVQGHAPSQHVLVDRKRQVKIVGIEPVGSYAVCLVFDDGHDSGLYTWDYLKSMGERQEQMMADYIAALEERGLGRD